MNPRLRLILNLTLLYFVVVTQMLYDIAKKFVSGKFESIKEVVGVLLTGSASLGYVDALSDIDLTIVAEQPLFRVLKEFCGNEGFCGVEIWWEWTTLQEIECALRDWKDDVDLWVYSKAKILYDPKHTVENLLKKYRRYPKRVWLEKLFLYWFFATAYAPYDSGKAIQRGDFLTAQLYLSQAMEYYTALVFILNHSFVPYRKWRLRELDKLAFKPKNYVENLRKNPHD